MDNINASDLKTLANAVNKAKFGDGTTLNRLIAEAKLAAAQGKYGTSVLAEDSDESIAALKAELESIGYKVKIEYFCDKKVQDIFISWK